MNFMRESDPAEARRGIYRLRSLVAKIPEEHYSELAANFGEGADNNLQRHLLQMAIYQEWGRMNLEAARADLSNVEEARRHEKALHGVFVGATDVDGKAAMVKAMTLDIETPGEFGDSERIDLIDSIFEGPGGAGGSTLMSGCFLWGGGYFGKMSPSL